MCQNSKLLKLANLSVWILSKAKVLYLGIPNRHVTFKWMIKETFSLYPMSSLRVCWANSWGLNGYKSNILTTYMMFFFILMDTNRTSSGPRNIPLEIIKSIWCWNHVTFPLIKPIVLCWGLLFQHTVKNLRATSRASDSLFHLRKTVIQKEFSMT